MRKIRNFLCFFICSFYLNCPTTEEQKCIPACHTFYMSYDKHVKRMTSMYICPHSSTIPLKLDGMESIPFPSIVIVVLFMHSFILKFW